jgi:hypothetical protein
MILLLTPALLLLFAFGDWLEGSEACVELGALFGVVPYFILQWTLVNPVTYVPLLLDRINQRTGLSNSV